MPQWIGAYHHQASSASRQGSGFLFNDGACNEYKLGWYLKCFDVRPKQYSNLGNIIKQTLNILLENW